MINSQLIQAKYGLPPNMAKLQIVGKITTSAELGPVSAEDLSPVDWRSKISPARNQQQCGDCWAMSSTSALMDRYWINGHSGLKLQPALVAQCVGNVSATGQQDNAGCGGGFPYDAGLYFENVGLKEISGSCPEWSQVCGDNCQNLPSCDTLMNECADSKTYKAVQGTTRSLVVMNGSAVDVKSTLDSMKKYLHDGPFPACFFVPKDFMGASILQNFWKSTNGVFINGSYNDEFQSIAQNNSAILDDLGIASPSSWGDIMLENGSPAGHAVEIVGWERKNAGKYGDVDCWIVKNSWGTNWGANGYFHIAMYPHNQTLGLDIPVSDLVMSSTGQTQTLGALFGGATCFDVPTGGSKPSPPSPPGGGGGNLGKSMSKKTKKKVVWIIGGIVILLVLFLLIKFKPWKEI